MSTLTIKNALFLSTLIGATAVFNVACAWGESPNLNHTDAYLKATPDKPKPVAGRNRRRTQVTRPLSVYPQANTDRIRVSVGANKVRINVLSNDRGRYLRLSAVNPRSARGGKVYLKNNRVIYLPLRGYTGNDSFWYSVTDRSGHKHSAKVIVCVCDN